MLTTVRVLDLTDYKGFYCGKVLAEYGMDVVKIEPPGGDTARDIGPFYHDIVDPEKSLFWWAYNDSKRGITLDLLSPDGKSIFKDLVRKADIVIESYDPGFMEKQGLSYESLEKVNPKLIMTSITPFGQTGPYKDYKGSDLISMAMGGIMSQTGERGGVPVRLDQYHTYCLTGSNAALAVILAYFYRETSGEGQYIDVSMTECVTRENYREVPVSWEFGHYNAARMGQLMYRGKFYSRTIWPCKDGHVTWSMFGGAVGAQDNENLAKWMADEGVLGDLTDVKWRELNFETMTQAEMDRIESHIEQLTKKYDRRYLEREAIRREIRLSPVNDVKELFDSDQLKHRNFWMTVDHPELSTKISYPGQLYLSSEMPGKVRNRAPLIGEHNEEIYVNELGLDAKKVIDLKKKGII